MALPTTGDAGGTRQTRAVAAAGAPVALLSLAVVHLATIAAVSLDYDPTHQTLHVGLFSTLTVALSLAGYWILATRQTRGAKLFAATLVVAALRTGVDVLQVVLGEVWTVHRVLVAVAPLLELIAVLTFLRFAGRYADEPALSGERARTASLVIAALATVAVATNSLHWQVGTFSRQTLPFVHLAWTPGPLGWALTGLTVAILLAGAGLLARSFTVAEQPDWWSAAMLTMGICLTVVVVVLDGLDQVPVANYGYGGIAITGFLVLTTPALLGHGLRRIEITARESMLRELDDPIVIVDDKRRVVDFTAAARDLLPENAAGEPFEAVFDVVPEWPPVGEIATTEVDRAEIVGARVGAADDGVGTADGVGADDGATDDDAAEAGEASSEGAEVTAHYLMQTSPVTSETGDVIGYTVRFADVTDLKRRTAELARKNEQLDQFADTISSDLREPLEVASEYVDRLERAIEAAGPEDTLDADTVREYLGTVDRSLRRMQHIIDDLLALARDTDPVSDVETVQFSAVAADAWDLIDPDRGRLRANRDGTLQADRECLQRVFENLYRVVLEADGEADADGAEGAADTGADGDDATGPGDVQIAVDLTEDGFTVTARGPGLPENHERMTLEPAESAAPGQQRLELAIVDHIASAHGWDVAVEPSDGAIGFVVTGCTTGPEEPLAGEAA